MISARNIHWIHQSIAMSIFSVFLWILWESLQITIISVSVTRLEINIKTVWEKEREISEAWDDKVGVLGMDDILDFRVTPRPKKTP